MCLTLTTDDSDMADAESALAEKKLDLGNELKVTTWAVPRVSFVGFFLVMKGRKFKSESDGGITLDQDR